MARITYDFNEMKQAVVNYDKIFSDPGKYNEARDSASKWMIPSRCEIMADIFKNSYLIPEYQRDYAWGTTQVDDFIGTVKRTMYASKYVQNMGDIIIHKEDKRAVNGQMYSIQSLVDGQQRLTTSVLALVVLRDFINAIYKESPESKENPVNPVVNMIRQVLWPVVKNEKGEDVSQPVLVSLTRPDFNVFLNDIFSNVGITYNLAEFQTKYKNGNSVFDTNVKVAVDNISTIHKDLYRPFRGKSDEDKRALLRYFECFADCILHCITCGIMVLSDEMTAKETYYARNMTGMRMSEAEGFKFQLLAQNSPKEKCVEYGEFWNIIKDKYNEYGRNDNSMGFITLIRSILKAQYTDFASRHSSSTEAVLCSTAANNVIYGCEKLGFGPNEVILVERMKRWDKCLTKAMNLENSKFGDTYRKNFIYLRLCAGTSKWLTALIAAFDILGDRAYSYMDKYSQCLVDAVMFGVTGRDSMNLSLIDDCLDNLICDLYRTHKKTPFTEPYRMIEHLRKRVEESYTSGQGDKATALSFCNAWNHGCNNRQVKLAVVVGYEYLKDPNFYSKFKKIKANDLELLNIMGKTSENLNNPDFVTAQKARWGCVVADKSLKRNKEYISAQSVLSLRKFENLLKSESYHICPNLSSLWMNVFRKKASSMDKYTETLIQNYALAIRDAYMKHLKFI